MNWYERRAMILIMAETETEPGWGCVRLVHERHIGRVVMFRKYHGFAAGFYPPGATCRLLDSRYQADQKARTISLPK